jgi:hypothetical protein
MQKSLLIVAALLFVSPVTAEPSGTPKPAKSTSTGKTLPWKGATSRNSCAAYGPGFVKVDGTDTCVQISGAVSIGVGRSSR